MKQKHICKVCGKDFDRDSKLVRHMITQTKKLFTCDKCFRHYKIANSFHDHLLKCQESVEPEAPSMIEEDAHDPVPTVTVNVDAEESRAVTVSPVADQFLHAEEKPPNSLSESLLGNTDDNLCDSFCHSLSDHSFAQIANTTENPADEAPSVFVLDDALDIDFQAMSFVENYSSLLYIQNQNSVTM